MATKLRTHLENQGSLFIHSLIGCRYSVYVAPNRLAGFAVNHGKVNQSHIRLLVLDFTGADEPSPRPNLRVICNFATHMQRQASHKS